MRNEPWNMKVRDMLVVAILLVTGGCLFQENPFGQNMPENSDQCVTPLQRMYLSAASGGISANSDGTLFGVADGDIFLFNNKGELLWIREAASTYALLLNNGKFILAELYNNKESWKSSIVKFDSEGNRLWERQTGLIGLDGLAVTPDGSFIAVGATDQDKNGHLMLFDEGGNKLWDHQIDGRIETVAVSESGYVVAGPRDRYIYLYDRNGELLFEYFAGSYYDSQDTVISPDESFFLFGSEHTYLNSYTLTGELLWQRDVGDLCNIRVSIDSEYIVVGRSGNLLLLDRLGNILWSRKVTDAFFIEQVAISDHAEYIAINTQRGSFLPRLYLEVYSREGELLWQYEGNQPFMAIAISGDGHYLAAGNQNTLLFFDNFQAIEEYASSECAQKGAPLV